LNAEGQSASIRISPQGEVAGVAECPAELRPRSEPLWSQAVELRGRTSAHWRGVKKRRAPPAIFSWNWRSPRQSREERQLFRDYFFASK
jgi:hypothetical protein